MKKIILKISLFFAVFTLQAQEWETNFDHAKDLASKENKNIVLDVDVILDKASKHGLDSLTKEEIEYLKNNNDENIG